MQWGQRKTVRMSSFNSLSRDHFLANHSPDIGLEVVDFQLPLSGSHVLLHFEWSMLYVTPLSTPSLGITKQTSFRTSAIAVKSFNSLSRDHGAVTERAARPPSSGKPFNSLSRDHRTLFRDFPALRGFPPRRPFAHLYFSATI